MSKKIKMVLYGEPGVGKSVFASKAPKPFFICTDGNYEWLEDFGADSDAHLNVTSWSQIKTFLSNPDNFKDYETIVVDLVEDAFKWCEAEYCKRNKIEHLSDLGYGKGYDATRNEFFIEISKLFALDKNIILIMHGLHIVVKDRRGVETTKYVPSSRIPDKLIDMIEGRVRYFLRCYIKDIEQSDGTVFKKRFLSLVPKPNEFGIIRGVDENSIPQDIPLDWHEFMKAIGVDDSVVESKVYDETKARKRRTKVETEEKEKLEEVKAQIEEMPWKDEPEEEVKEEVKKTPKEEVKEVKEEPKILSNEDKLAAIRAKLAALNNKQ